MGLDIHFSLFFRRKTTPFDADRRRLTPIFFKNGLSMDAIMTPKHMKLGDDVSMCNFNATFGLRQIPAWSCM